jgi:hypothetical protein
VCASDLYGNYTPLLNAYEGQSFEMTKDTSGDVLNLCQTPAVSPVEVEMKIIYWVALSVAIFIEITNYLRLKLT